MEEMYRAAASFFDEAPWFLLSSHNIIEIRNMNTNEHRVIQICGNSFNDIGLMMWRSVRDFKRILVPGISEVDAIIKGEVYQTLFYPEDEAELDLKQLFSKSNLPYPVLGGVKFFADICLLGSRQPTKEEVVFMYAALTLIPHMVRESFNKWKPVEQKFILSNVFGSKQKTLYVLKYPAEGKRIDEGQRRLGPLPSCVDPIRAESVAEAFDKEVGRIREEVITTFAGVSGLVGEIPGRHAASTVFYTSFCRHLIYSLKGLADTLWKLQQTDKAAELSRKMLWLDPSDNIQVTEMLVDFVLELGRYEEVMPLLTRDEFFSPIVLWTSTLVDFVKYGGEHGTTQKALLQALKHHPDVFSIITGVKSLPRAINRESTILVGVSTSLRDGMKGNFIYAAHYCKNFAKYWRNAPGAVDWLKDYGTKLLAKLNEPGGKSNMQSFPKPNLMVCFHCHAHKETGLLKCSQCKRASYCNRECQKAHWKEHKPSCVAIPTMKIP